MRIASKVLVFFCFPFHVLGYQMYFVRDIDIYNDLMAMNTTCSPEDMCLKEREEDSPGITPGRRCSCHTQCAVYDTCCYNSPHRGDYHPLMECTRIMGSGRYFLVGKCPSDAPGYSVWKSLCEDPWNGEDDILKIAPVTSLDTRTVYKNIYCFRCHESSDNFHQWYLHVEGATTDRTADSKDYAVSYDEVYGSWMAVSDDNSVSVRVDVYFSSAPKRGSVEYVHTCNAYVISDCHDSWTDDYVRDKCRGYYALRYVYERRKYGYDIYKNPHCAICNYAAPEEILCTRSHTPSDTADSHGRPRDREHRPPARPPIRPPSRPPVRPTTSPPVILNNRRPVIPNSRRPARPPTRTSFNEDDRGGEEGRVRLFSFFRLIGGMFYGGDKKSEKLQKKCDEYHLWDPYGKRCRRIACALPGYGLRNGRCRRL